jgi:predicted amidohydrolase YtcJ
MRIGWLICLLTFWIAGGPSAPSNPTPPSTPSGLTPPPAPADLVLTNANIITLQSPGHRAQAVAISGALVIATGDTGFIRQYIGPNTRIIDLQGRTVVPGFNDVHQHPFPVYTWNKPYASLELDTVSSMESLIDLLRRKAAITPKGMLIRGSRYNEARLGHQPTRDYLDQASTDHPILISHASGHLEAANSYMLRISHIDRESKDPPGGTLERDANGDPDGIIKESASRLLTHDTSIEPPRPTPEEELDGYHRCFRQMLASGITSIGDCWTTPAKVKMYQTLVAEDFPMRFNLYIGVDYLDQVLSGQIPRVHSDFLRIDGIKIFHGNSFSGKTCWVYEPYDTVNPAIGKKDYYGIPPARSQAGLDSLVRKINHAGLQIACHSNGDREIDMVLTAYERAQQADYHPDIRNRIEHCSITNQSILDRIKRDSIIPVFHSYANELGNQLEVYGPKRLAMIMPTRTATDMGIIWAMHSDYSVSRYEPMRRLDGAVNRKAPNGMIIGENQKIGVEEAIRAYCVGGAYTSHEEAKKGCVVPGQFADLVVLGSDPTAVDPSTLKDVKVEMVLVGGKVVYGR